MILDEDEKIFKSDENDSDALLNEFLNRYDFYNDEDKHKISKAWALLINKCGDKKRSCGTPYYVHPLRVSDILAQNKMDADTIISAILHTIQDFGVTEAEIKEDFGEQAAKIIEGVNKIMHLPANSKTLQQADAIRKMLFAMVDDVRIILVKLADRLDRIRHIKSVEKENQRILAEEVIDIWAPLADRLGMQTEKNEFEDLSLRYTNPEAFVQIQKIVNQSKAERAAYLEAATNKIKASAYKAGIEVTVMSRAKHFYSIYQKMRKRNKSAGELYDLLALRILCNTPAECYTLIGIVHGLWTPLEGRFKDYIAVPKANGYQSLHTTVMSEGHPLEIQIRTYEMHNMAEHGIASHWLYKKGTNHDLVEADKLDIFNKLQKLKESVSADSSAASCFMDSATFKNLKNELLGDEIYVFTPKGDVKKLPNGSTAIDFAYAIHTAIGEKIIAAKADGKIIPLNKPLQNTQIVEIITNPNAHPTEAQLSVVKTSKAHQKIHSWLMINDPTFSERLALQKSEELGSTNGGAVTNASGGSLPAAEGKSSVNLPRQRKARSKKNPNPEAAIKHEMRKVLVQGQRNVMYTMAQCCKPYYPNLICGYVTRSKGVSIHRADCLVYQSNPEKEKRSVEVSWDSGSSDKK